MSERVPENETIVRMNQAIMRATEAVCGDPQANPLEVFPNPEDKERREDVVFGADLTPEQEADFRAAMAELGPGRQTDKGLDLLRLSNANRERYCDNFTPGQYEWKAVLEAGQLHKGMAELELVLAQPLQPSLIVVTAAPGRIIGEKEKALSARLLKIPVEEVGDNEYEVYCQFLQSHPRFKPLPEGVEHLPFGYDLGEGSRKEGFGVSPMNRGNGQFVRLGSFGEIHTFDDLVRPIPLVMIRVDRFPDPNFPDDPSKYIQPNNAQKMCYAANLNMRPDYKAVDINVGFVTSATYQPSCELAADEAVSNFEYSEYGMTAQVLTYGAERLAVVKGEESYTPAVNQLAAEAYKVADMLQKATTE